MDKMVGRNSYRHVPRPKEQIPTDIGGFGRKCTPQRLLLQIAVARTGQATSDHTCLHKPRTIDTGVRISTP